MIRIILLMIAFYFPHAHAQEILCRVDEPLPDLMYIGARIVVDAQIQENNVPFIFQTKPKGISIQSIGIMYKSLEEGGVEYTHSVVPDIQYSDSEWDGFRTVNAISHLSLSTRQFHIRHMLNTTQWSPVDQRDKYIRGVPGNSLMPQISMDSIQYKTVSEASLNINNIITVPDLSGGEEHAIQLGTAGNFTRVGGGNITIKAASGDETGTMADPFKTSHSGVTVALNNNGTIAPNEDITATVRVAPEAASGPYTLNLVATANCP